MVLARLEDKPVRDSARAILTADPAMRLLAEGKLGAKLVALAETAAAIHRSQVAAPEPPRKEAGR